MHIAFNSILCEMCGWAIPRPSGPVPTENYADVATSPPGLWRASFSWKCKVPPPQLHHRALSTPNIQKMAVFDPLSVLINAEKPSSALGCRVRSFHATSPLRSVPPITEMNDPGQSETSPHDPLSARRNSRNACSSGRVAVKACSHRLSCWDYHSIAPKFEDIWMRVIEQGSGTEAAINGVNAMIDSMTRKPLCNENYRGVGGEMAVEQRHVNQIFIDMRKRDF